MTGKKYELNVDSHLKGRFLFPIRSKLDLIKVLLEAMRFISAGIQFSENEDKLFISVSRHSRIFFYFSEKKFSIALPFSIKKDEQDNFTFSSNLYGLIDAKSISDLIKIFNSSVIENPLDLAGEIEICQPSRTGFWHLVRDLMLFDCGYIRYDHDSERENGNIHPLYHLDVFHSNHSSFKLGLNNSLNIVDFIDILDVSSNCHYLNKP